MVYLRKNVLFFSLCVYQFFLCQSVVLTTKKGVIIGTTLKTRGGRKVNSYRGIPYALPPLNELRFQDPVPAKPLKGVFYATKDGSECVQRGNENLQQPLKVSGNENCLTLSIYVPAIKSHNKKLPVMFFIYGGGWVTGSNERSLYGPEYLLDKDIVLVVVNYRLDVFGFFSSGDYLAPGNFGLKDQALALRWVSQYIDMFGGDASQITIFGESVGGISVNSLMFSNLSKDLFQRVISISGTIDMPVAHLPVEMVADATKQLAKAVGCPTAPSEALLQCMQTIPYKELIEKQEQLAPEGFPPFVLMTWIPVYDYNISKSPFFPVNPRTTPNRPTYPWINGATSFDGTYFIGHIYAYPDFVARLEANPRQYLPDLLYLEAYLPPENIPEVTDRIVNFYFGNGGSVNQETLTILMTDAFFFIPAVRSSLDYGGPVYFYLYDFPYPESWDNVYGPPGVVKPRPGHTDILLNLFEISQFFNRTDDTQTDERVSDNLIELFTSFATTGDPTSNSNFTRWNTIGTEENFNYLYLGETFVQRQNPYPERVSFWRSLQQQYPDLY